MSEIQKLIGQLKEINGNNRNSIYNAHIYWAQKPFNIISILIDKLSRKGDIILDPFMGSGVTIIEALKLGENRKVIGNDINEFPVFLVESLIKDYNIKDIKNKFNKFMKDIRNDFGSIYNTRCQECNELKTADRFIFHKRNDGFVLDSVKYKCKECFGGNRKPIKEPEEIDLNLFNKENNIDEYYFEDINLIENSRIAVQEGQKLSDLFTNRALYILNMICKKISKEDNSQFKLFLKLTLSSILHLAKITDKRSNSQWLLWYPDNNCLEKNIINLFKKRGKLVIKALISAEKEGITKSNKARRFEELTTKDKNYLLLKKPAQNIIKELSCDSIDLIITDPPYVDQIPYSEYMQLYKGFLKTEFNLNDEIIISNSNQRKKDEDDYFDLIGKAFENMSLLLKEGKYLCLFFHDNNLKYWNKLIKLSKKNNLEFIDQVHIYKNNKTVKNISNPKKSLQGDSIVFLKKIKKYEHKLGEKNHVDIERTKKLIKKKCAAIIEEFNGATTAQLYDNGLLKLLIQEKSLDYFAKSNHTLINEIEEYHNFNNGKWHKKS